MNVGLFAEPTTETFFHADNFEATFHKDLIGAKRNIVIAVKRLRLGRTSKILDLLTVATQRGTSVTIAFSEGAH